MEKLLLKSPAKINLYLKVSSRRSDGYYNIKTLFERIDLCDKITLTIIPQNKIEIHCDDPDVPVDKTNLAFRAARLLKKNFSITSGVRIDITKRIPVSSGLGGGSSNAAHVLLGLNKLWELKLNKDIMMEYARRIGADVAFFVADKPFAIGLGRGDNIYPLGITKTFWHVLAVPNIGVSTKQVYKGFRLTSPIKPGREDLQLTKPPFDITIISYVLNKGGLSDIRPLVYNDLETVTIKKHKRILKIIRMLEKSGGVSGMSGSGPAVFGVISRKNQAERIAGRLNKFKDIRVFVVKTY